MTYETVTSSELFGGMVARGGLNVNRENGAWSSSSCRTTNDASTSEWLVSVMVFTSDEAGVPTITYR